MPPVFETMCLKRKKQPYYSTRFYLSVRMLEIYSSLYNFPFSSFERAHIFNHVIAFTHSLITNHTSSPSRTQQ